MNNPTRNPSARAAAHRAMARAALFSDTSASTRLKRYTIHMTRSRALEDQAGLPLFEVYLARSATRLEIHAPSWRDALRRTGRPDACIIEHRADGEMEATFDPDSPVVITCRLRYGSPSEALRWALDNVSRHLDLEEVQS